MVSRNVATPRLESTFSIMHSPPDRGRPEWRQKEDRWTQRLRRLISQRPTIAQLKLQRARVGKSQFDLQAATHPSAEVSAYRSCRPQKSRPRLIACPTRQAEAIPFDSTPADRPPRHERVFIFVVPASDLKHAIMDVLFDGLIGEADVEGLFTEYGLEHD
jgi:hypothetical protein